MFYQKQHFGVSEYFCKETGENFTFPKHIHHSFECIIVLEGCMEISVDESTYSVSCGEGVLVFPEQLHALESTESKHLLVIFSPDIVSAFYRKHLGESPESNKIKVPPYLIDQIRALEKDSSVIKMKAALYAIGALLDESTAYAKTKNTANALLHAVFDFVEQNFDKDCSLERMSAVLGYHPAYLSRYFSQATGTSFLSFVNRYKISRACYLLSGTDKTVLACAYDCGYTSLRSFNRNFKIQTGMTPKQYREQSKHGAPLGTL